MTSFSKFKKVCLDMSKLPNAVYLSQVFRGRFCRFPRPCFDAAWPAWIWAQLAEGVGDMKLASKLSPEDGWGKNVEEASTKSVTVFLM